MNRPKFRIIDGKKYIYKEGTDYLGAPSTVKKWRKKGYLARVIYVAGGDVNGHSRSIFVRKPKKKMVKKQ
jgi:hypothetical protein